MLQHDFVDETLFRPAVVEVLAQGERLQCFFDSVIIAGVVSRFQQAVADQMAFDFLEQVAFDVELFIGAFAEDFVKFVKAQQLFDRLGVIVDTEVHFDIIVAAVPCTFLQHIYGCRLLAAAVAAGMLRCGQSFDEAFSKRIGGLF